MIHFVSQGTMEEVVVQSLYPPPAAPVQEVAVEEPVEQDPLVPPPIPSYVERLNEEVEPAEAKKAKRKRKRVPPDPSTRNTTPATPAPSAAQMMQVAALARQYTSSPWPLFDTHPHGLYSKILETVYMSL